MEIKINSRSIFRPILMTIMRTLIFLCFTVAFSLTPNAIVSQNSKIEVKEDKNLTVEEVFKLIMDQTDYNFFFEKGIFKNFSKVHIKKGIIKTNKLLKRSLSQGDFDVQIDEDNTIIIKEKPLNNDMNEKQQIAISGVVNDQDGQSLPGANIVEKGTSNGSQTDFDGKFSFNVSSENATLIVSFLGFTTQEIPLNGQTEITISMEKNASALDEIVVVGYGTQKKENLTGSYEQISGEVLENRPVANIGQALQGQIGNLNITVAGDPGGVGTPASFNVRGFTSINGGGPLLVVDGVPIDDLQNINPQDVESVTVLKDAAASAIYGGRAAFGVILITTKSGTKGKTIVNYNNILAWNAPTTLPKMANSLEFALATNESGANSGANPLFSDEHLDRIRTYLENPGSIPTTLPWGGNPNWWGWVEGNDNNDWYDVYLKEWTPTQKHDLSVSGGSDAVTYYLSLGHYHQKGLFEFGDDRYTRNNLTSDITANPLSWMKLNLKTRYSEGTTNEPHAYGPWLGNWFHLAGTRWPTWPLINPDGNASWVGVEPWYTQPGRDITKTKNIWFTGGAELTPIKGVNVNIQYSRNHATNNNSQHRTPIYQILVDGSKQALVPNSRITRSLASSNYQSINVYASYQKQLGGHHFKLLAGHQQEKWDGTSILGTNTGLINDNLPSFAVATGEPIISNALTHRGASGTFGRFNYNYKEKFLLEVNARYDGTSVFPEGDRFGFFPSVSVGYDLAKEDFWPVEDIDQLKLRASYGSLGNQDVINSLGNYPYLSQIPIRTGLPYILGGAQSNYLTSPGLVSSSLTWETVRTTNIGFDATLFKNKLELSYEWYRRETLDMLGRQAPLPAVLGAGLPVGNNADLQTTGVELNIRWRDNIGDLNYHASLVLSDNKTKITRYHNPTKLLDTWVAGLTVGDLYGYTSDGLFQTEEEVQNGPDQSIFYPTWNPGDVRYKDLDGDGEITRGNLTLGDSGDLQVIGNNTPRYSYGFTLGGDWKGFDFNMFVQGIGKRDYWLSGTNFWGFLGAYGSAVWKTTLDYWSPENTNAYWPRPYATGEIGKNQQVQTRFLQNAAYMRLKNIQLGYTFPKALVNRMGIEKVRIFATGENLLTFTKLNDNFDPETIGGSWGSGKVYPILKSLSFGINLQL